MLAGWLWRMLDCEGVWGWVGVWLKGMYFCEAASFGALGGCNTLGVPPAFEGTTLEACDPPCGVAYCRLKAGGALAYGDSWYVCECCDVYWGWRGRRSSDCLCVCDRLGVPNCCASLGTADAGADMAD